MNRFILLRILYLTSFIIVVNFNSNLFADLLDKNKKISDQKFQSHIDGITIIPDLTHTNFSPQELIQIIQNKRVKKIHTPWIAQLRSPLTSCSAILIESVKDEDASDYESITFPWVDLYSAPRWLLTAAHCVHLKDLKFFNVIAGSIFHYSKSDLEKLRLEISCRSGSKNSECECSKYKNNSANDLQNLDYDSLEHIAKFCDRNIRIIKIDKRYSFVHENYDPINYDNDIALLMLKPITPTSSGNIASITLPTEKQLQVIERHHPNSLNPPQHKNQPWLFSAGWGASSSKGESKPKHLRIQKYPFVNYHKCKNAYLGAGRILPENVICVGELNSGIDICDGDSGGPLFYNFKLDTIYHPSNFPEHFPENILLGIASTSKNCTSVKKETSIYSVFTKITSYEDWIIRNITCNFPRKPDDEKTVNRTKKTNCQYTMGDLDISF